MNSKSSFDLLEAWRDLLTKFENDTNYLANDSMRSEQFSRMFGFVAPLYAQMRQINEKALDAYFKAFKLPNRDDIAALEEHMQRLEDKIDLLLLAELREPPEARPLRTRKPSGDGNAIPVPGRPQEHKD